MKTGFWVFSIIGALAATTAGVVASYSRSDRIFPGVTVVGNAVDGLTRVEAEARVAEWSAMWARHEIAITSGDRRWTAPIGQLGIRADVREAIERAYAVGRQEKLARRVAARLGIGAPDISLNFKSDPRALDPVLAKIAKSVNVPHQNARMHLVDDKFEIDGEVAGRRVDEDATRNAILEAAQLGWPAVEVVIVTDPAEVTAEELQSIDTVLAAYTTRFPAWRKDRTHNITIAAKEIDGTVVPAGGVFSYNEVVGPREKERGYREAPIFQNGMLVPGTGGGVCQVSSTLYNAALLSNMEIVRRSHHSSEVPYVPKGRDATVAYGLLDLKFRNTTSTPIYIAAALKGSNLTLAIYGSSNDKADVGIEVVGAGKSQAGTSSVRVYRIVKKPGAADKRELVSRDTYRPVVVAETAPKPPPKRTTPPSSPG